MSRRLGRDVGAFLRLPWREQRLVLEAAAMLAMAGIALRMVPFRRIVARLERPSPRGRRSRFSVSEVAQGIERAGRGLPWDATCLMRAVAGGTMLRRRGASSQLVLGVGRDPRGAELAAHAWIEIDGAAAVGAAEGHERLATFAIGSDRSAR